MKRCAKEFDFFYSSLFELSLVSLSTIHKTLAYSSQNINVLFTLKFCANNILLLTKS